MKIGQNNDFSFNRLLIVIFVLICLLGVIFFGAIRQFNTPLASSIVINTLAPVQSGISYVTRSITNFKDYVVDIFYVYDKNRQLEKENTELKLQLAKSSDLLTENAHLQTLLDYKNQHKNYDLVAAKIISRDSASWSNYIIINRGSNDGIKKYMPVITPDGLVGSVYKVYSSYAEVELITDPRSAVSAIVSRTQSRVTGVVKGTTDSSSSINLTNLPQYSDVKKGDTIITSGFGGIYPKGIVIGSVYKLETAPGGLLQYAVLYPAVNFQNLEEVFVIKNYERPPIVKDNNELPQAGDDL